MLHHAAFLTADNSKSPGRQERKLKAVDAHVAFGRHAAGQLGMRFALTCFMVINPDRHKREREAELLSSEQIKVKCTVQANFPLDGE